jgi:hypothetical protein
MKILFLHDKSGIKTARELLRETEKRQIPGILYCPGDEWSEDVLPEDNSAGVSAGSSAVTHVVTVFSDFPAFVPGLFFSLGFSLGARVPLISYGPGAGEPCGLKQGMPVKNKGDFIAYLEGEAINRTGEDVQKDAKAALLDMGIPYNPESLENCIREGKPRAVLLFLEAGFSPNARDKNGVPLLSLAARAGNRPIVDILLKAGAEVNLQAEDRGGSALIDSAMGKHCGILEDLLAAGADVNLKSKDGQSALVISVGLNDTVCAEMLLKAGANPDDPDLLGVSARKYATLFNRSAMVALFNAYALQ